MRTLALIGAGVAAAAVVAVSSVSRRSDAQAPAAVADSLRAPILAAGDTAGLPGPRQPIFFRHDIHAGQFKIQCQYCHYTVAVSPEPGIPSAQTCMGCHTVIAGSDTASRAEIKKLRDAWTQKKPIEWVRVHFLPRHAHFPHSRHIKALGPNGCQTCHGDVTRMAQVFKANEIGNMGWCISCHLERNISRDCTVCHY
jgi:cytochrome c7-like protein/class III cytochrome C family protein